MDGHGDPIAKIGRELTAEGIGSPAVSSLLPEAYEELRRIAAALLATERVDHTLQPTALVHEAYVRLARRERELIDEAHFFRLAAKAMRHILIDHARRRRTAKRAGGSRRVSLLDEGPAAVGVSEEILELDDALEQLSAFSAEMARVVELRFFAGCTIEQTGEALGLSTASVERQWRFARAWLRMHLSRDEPTDRAS